MSSQFLTRAPSHLWRSVKAAVPILIQLDGSVGQLPTDIAKRHGEIVSAQAKIKRADLVSQVWAPAVADKKQAEWEEAIPMADGNPSYRPYDRNTFIVESWQGVQVTADTAVALVAAHEEYFAGSEALAVDPVRQYQVQLVRGGKHGWQLSSVVRVDVPGGGQG